MLLTQRDPLCSVSLHSQQHLTLFSTPLPPETHTSLGLYERQQCTLLVFFHLPAVCSLYPLDFFIYDSQGPVPGSPLLTHFPR